jgi:hypothetical protein
VHRLMCYPQRLGLEGGSALRRIVLLFVVVALVAAMVLLNAVSGFAEEGWPPYEFPFDDGTDEPSTMTSPLPTMTILPPSTTTSPLLMRTSPPSTRTLKMSLLSRTYRSRRYPSAHQGGCKSGTRTGRVVGGTSGGTSIATRTRTDGTERTTVGTGDTRCIKK